VAISCEPCSEASVFTGAFIDLRFYSPQGRKLIDVDLNPKGGETEMGRTLENKKEIVADLKSFSADAQLAFVIDFKGYPFRNFRSARSPAGKRRICKDD
jgi:hypothetical protein